jgi:hypothetical protein
MEQFEEVCKGLQTAVDSDWMWRKADYIAMCCKDALALIRQQQERIKELEAGNKSKPVKTSTNSYGHKFYYCPNCGRWFEFRKLAYCDQCGQKVKWDG